jgi:hypothetical protein
MQILICPGIHPPRLTEQFLQGLGWANQADRLASLYCFPSADEPVYSPWHVYQFLHARGVDQTQPLLLIGFSAGVVGAIGAARLWQQQGGQVKALIALDGWGVPLVGNFALHRISHDWFTHWNFGWPQPDSFYADPSVDHLTLWQSPETVIGWHIQTSGSEQKTQQTVASYITDLVRRYETVKTLET